MKFDRLRIVGFKTFVDPTEMVVEPGLTGIVGPNGCGKSNLVEALRWVMGETSHKSMRASGMDDVIFSGSGQRPARNHAEVMLRVDNRDRTAPAAFNDADSLEISRKIEREDGSTYRINGREVRARDVQLLFADAASGARSPSMVRQGQISEIIAAKPQARRRILEDAAGVAGLHARRHDAELKLRAAEDNLARVVDVLTHIDGQIDGLKRQVRQAERYRAIAAELRKAEALAHQIAWQGAQKQTSEAGRTLDLAMRAEAEAIGLQGQAERDRAVAQHAIEPLRVEEAQASEAHQRLSIAREALDGEERRARGRLEELARRIAELQRDEERARRLVDDAASSLTQLADERDALSGAGNDANEESAGQQRLAAAETEVAEAEQRVQTLQLQLAEASVGRNAAERAASDAAGRLQRLNAQLQDAARLKTQLEAGEKAGPDIEVLHKSAEAALAQLQEAEGRATQLDKALREAREAELRLRPALQEADRTAQRLETEARTIRKLFDTATSDLWPRAIDLISVAKGFEIALGAALGDDLEASINASAPAHWAGSEGSGDHPLPTGATPLADHIEAPAEMQRRLRQIGVVSRADGARLAQLLRPGQRLVSREGDLWRWDGFVAAAEAPSAAARRLAEKNRLGEIEISAREAAGKRDAVRATVEAALAAVRAATDEEFAAREAARNLRRGHEQAREALAGAERRAADAAARLRTASETVTRLTSEVADADAACVKARDELAVLADPGDLPMRVAEARAAAAERRTLAAQARAALEGLVRERDARLRRITALGQDIAAWTERRQRAEQQIAEITDRQAQAGRERADHESLPDTFIVRRRALVADIEAAEAARKVAADARAQGETALATFDRIARDSLAGLLAAKEGRARAEAQLEAARERMQTLGRDIEEASGVAPAALASLTGIAAGGELPEGAFNEGRLTELKRERERIGAVNLRAEEELSEVEGNKETLSREHGELGEAIRRLRRGIESLNAEGRERLVAAFDVVNGHFKTLFSRLFGGGTAELQLIESDDPLEAGLEILAHPPGKKPQVLTLLSGGEQALTATALIFAVFLTNPSPVCVLDEVDAPLDDSNVERLCDLLTDMAKETETRFVVITHNPISMARMDRLFGVTMAERGVSQLVSVDLEAAERLAEAV